MVPPLNEMKRDRVIDIEVVEFYGRQQFQSQVRRLLNEAFVKSRSAAEAASAKCFADPKTELACVELLARLDGELP
jgi:hypothetical protein